MGQVVSVQVRRCVLDVGVCRCVPFGGQQAGVGNIVHQMSWARSSLSVAPVPASASTETWQKCKTSFPPRPTESEMLGLCLRPGVHKPSSGL